MTVKREFRDLWAVAVVAVSLLAMAAPAGAQVQQAVLYELTENMSLFCDQAKTQLWFPSADSPTGSICVNAETGALAGRGGSPARRVATAQLQGYVAVGSALCPANLVTDPRAQTCTVTATGADDVTLELLVDSTTGKVTLPGEGTVTGSYRVVVQGDNPVDGPEFVVQSGTIDGRMDLSPTLLTGTPLGLITGGTITLNTPFGVVSRDFTGVFRLPFAIDGKGQKVKPRPGKGKAFYLGDDGEPFPVKDNERALSLPTVRFEMNIQ